MTRLLFASSFIATVHSSFIYESLKRTIIELPNMIFKRVRVDPTHAIAEVAAPNSSAVPDVINVADSDDEDVVAAPAPTAPNSSAVREVFDVADSDDEDVVAAAAHARPDYMVPTAAQRALARLHFAESNTFGDHAFVTRDDLILSGSSFCRLKGETWMNDEVINLYFRLIDERSRNHDEFRKVFSHSSLFWAKITESGYNYGNVARWSKQIDIFDFDLLFIPINLSNSHWILGFVDLKNQLIGAWDSLNQPDPEYPQLIEMYLRDEWVAKKGGPFPYHFSVDRTQVPKQDNMVDCGVFISMFAESLARGVGTDFSQADAAHARLQMAVQIKRGSILA